MAVGRWREKVSERHRRRHGPGKARFIRQINWVTPQWPFAGFAGFSMAALAFFLFVSFALYLPWYALAAYAALVGVTIVLLRVYWPRWLRQTSLSIAFAAVAILLYRLTPIHPLFFGALALGFVVSFWVGRRNELETRERDAFRRERT